MGAAVDPYERCAIALEHHGQLDLKAVSGMEEVNRSDADIKRLMEMIEWGSIFRDEILVNQRGEEIDEEDPKKHARFSEYFAQSGVRSFYLRPLEDDQGRVGVLVMESSEPDFLDTARLEIIKVVGRAGNGGVAKCEPVPRRAVDRHPGADP